MLKLLTCYHGRLLILVALVAAAFIANRKVAVLISYATIIGDSSQVSEDNPRLVHPQEVDPFPMGCKSLRVTAEYSKLKLAFCAMPVQGCLDRPGMEWGASPSLFPSLIVPLVRPSSGGPSVLQI